MEVKNLKCLISEQCAHFTLQPIFTDGVQKSKLRLFFARTFFVKLSSKPIYPFPTSSHFFVGHTAQKRQLNHSVGPTFCTSTVKSIVSDSLVSQRLEFSKFGTMK